MLTLPNMVLAILVWYLHPLEMVPQPSLPPQTEEIPMTIPILTPTIPSTPPLINPLVITLKCTTQVYLASGQLMPLPSQSHAEQILKNHLKQATRTLTSHSLNLSLM